MHTHMCAGAIKRRDCRLNILNTHLSGKYKWVNNSYRHKVNTAVTDHSILVLDLFFIQQSVRKHCSLSLSLSLSLVYSCKTNTMLHHYVGYSTYNCHVFLSFKN